MKSFTTISPRDAGFDAPALDSAVAAVMAQQTMSLIVVRAGRIVVETYAPDWHAAQPLEIASVAKSVVSVLVGTAIDEGHIRSVEQSASDFIPQWRGTSREPVTIRHLLTMTSGLDFKGLNVRGVTGDQFAINAAAPAAHAPGTQWAYATPIFHLLYHVVARAAGEPFETYAARALIDPLGLENWSWVTNEGRGESSPVTNYYSARTTARDLARFGLFALRGGEWNGRKLVSAGYLNAAISPSQDLNPAYGYLWWQNAQAGFPWWETSDSAAGHGHLFEAMPRDTFAALGVGGQVVVQIPSLDLVIVRQGFGWNRREFVAATASIVSALGAAAS